MAREIAPLGSKSLASSKNRNSIGIRDARIELRSHWFIEPRMGSMKGNYDAFAHRRYIVIHDMPVFSKSKNHAHISNVSNDRRRVGVIASRMLGLVELLALFVALLHYCCYCC